MCSVYIQNRCPHQILGQKTPHEFWSGHKPSVGHLRVFGSIAYAHVPDQQRKKLEDKSKKLVFVGYDDKSKAYRLYNRWRTKLKLARMSSLTRIAAGTGAKEKKPGSRENPKYWSQSWEIFGEKV